MPISERDVLDAIEEIVRQGSAYGSRERGKHFYDPLDLPARLSTYISAADLSIAQAAKMLGISSGSLKRILEGGSLSENMLFRIRNTMEYALGHPGISLQKEDDVFPGDWRGTSKRAVQDAIATVTEKLIFLRDAVLASNSLKSDDAPIDRLQIAQLIALLNATLAALQAPYVEAGQTGGFFRWLAKLGKRGVEKGLEGKISDAIDGATEAGSKLFDAFGNSSGPSDLGSIIT